MIWVLRPNRSYNQLSYNTYDIVLKFIPSIKKEKLFSLISYMLYKSIHWHPAPEHLSYVLSLKGVEGSWRRVHSKYYINLVITTQKPLENHLTLK